MSREGGKLSIRALRSLISVHRHGSFRAAADAEHLTPAAISQQMRSLELSLDLVLFDRSERTMQLTETGLDLVTEASGIVAAYDNLAETVGALDNLSGELILGAVPTTLTGLVPLALSQLKLAHPGVKIRIVPGLSNQLLLQLHRGQIHAAIISRPEILPASLAFSQIAREELTLLVAASISVSSPVDLLKSLPFIRFNRDAVVGRQIEAWLQQNDILVNDVMELEGLDAISSMVAAELGISIVPNLCIAENRHLPLKTISLGKDAPCRTLGLVRHKDTPRTKFIGAVEYALIRAVEIGELNWTTPS